MSNFVSINDVLVDASKISIIEAVEPEGEAPVYYFHFRVDGEWHDTDDTDRAVVEQRRQALLDLLAIDNPASI